MSETEVFYNKLYNEDKTRLFRIKTEWDENLFKLSVVEGTTAWFALVTKEHIDMLAAQHEIDCDTYYKNIKEYICRNQSGVTFDIAKKQFFIYRNLEKFRMKYFFVNLEKMVYQETMETLVDDFSAKYTHLLEGLRVLEELKLEADSQKLLYEKKLKQFTELKRKSDLQMYSAFLLLLNEKKHRIRFLTEALENKGGTKRKINETATSSKQLKNNSKSTVKETQKAIQREELSDSDSNPSDGYNTDDEKQAKAVKEITAVPGTSKDNFDFLGSDSPPPKLPKRGKREEKDKCQVSSSIKDVDRQIQKNGVKQQPVDTKMEESDESDLDFNTQELLDRM